MKTLYIECNMGAAGDMLMAALLELINNKEEFIKRINEIGINGVTVSKDEAIKCGIRGTHISVLVDGEEENEHMHEHHSHEHHSHHHIHRGVTEIEQIINSLNVSDNVKQNAVEVYKLIAQAEAFVHGREINNIHFHEVGTFDAICDIVGVCMLMEEINADVVIASPINVGGGQVKCAHGILPVPTPATEYILRGIPIYSGDIKSELCTPTGAALLKHFVSRFDKMPPMSVEKTGYGMGNKDFESANCVRAFIGETTQKEENIIELSANIDDMTGEEIGFAVERLMECGCLDVYTQSIIMKKGRPAILLNIIIREEQRDEVVKAVFKHTSTIGIREYSVKRHTLNRCIKTADTKYGRVNYKVANGYGVQRKKPEYEDIAEIARKNNTALNDIKADLGDLE